MPVIQRRISTKPIWFTPRQYWRFKYHDPDTGETLRLAGIDLPRPRGLRPIALMRARWEDVNLEERVGG